MCWEFLCRCPPADLEEGRRTNWRERSTTTRELDFAVPLEHILNILSRWKQGEDLLPGKLGIALAKGDAHITQPKILSVWPGSPAAKAGWQAKDLITKVDGVEVATQAQLRFQILPRYAGDSVHVSLEREGQELESEITLAGKLAPFRHAFLGVLPVRNPANDQVPGSSVKSVWPGSPAEAAGIESGDRIVKLNNIEVKSTAQARETLAGLQPEQQLDIVVQRGQQEKELQATLSFLPEEILEEFDRNTKAGC